MDFFASNKNAKCTAFFSQTYCPGTVGVDAFNYDWSVYGLGWIFVSPKMVLRTVSYLKKFKAKGLILVPQWKTSHFYPVLLSLKNTKSCLGVMVYSEAGIVLQGADSGSYFGPGYRGNVEVWNLDCNR